MTTLLKEDNISQEEERESKIQELREIITNAQETISSATQLLSAIQGVSPVEMPISQADTSEEEDGQSTFGYFDGQIMIGDDGRQYPVPANYASKSKLVEGDKLKLNITPDNRFVYKQIGPVQRNYLIGLVKKDTKGNFTIQTAEKEYHVLLAAATYFKIEENDEVTLIVPQGKTTIWGAIENVLQKKALTSTSEPINMPSVISNTATPNNNANLGFDTNLKPDTENIPEVKTTLRDEVAESAELKELTAIEKLEIEMEREKLAQSAVGLPSPKNREGDNHPTVEDGDEWASDIEKLKQEAGISAR